MVLLMMVLATIGANVSHEHTARDNVELQYRKMPMLSSRDCDAVGAQYAVHQRFRRTFVSQLAVNRHMNCIDSTNIRNFVCCVCFVVFLLLRLCQTSQ